MRHRYTSATRIEKWRFEGCAWRRSSVHLDSGFAETAEDGGGYRIEATSAECPLRPNVRDEVLQALDRLSGAAARATATLRSHHRVVECDGSRSEAVSDTISVSIHAPCEISFTLPVEAALLAIEPLTSLAVSAPRTEVDARAYPIVWRKGSGAILLHEAVGHPSELAPDPLRWPSWLEVADEPHAGGLGFMPVDDVGRETERRSLTSGGQPSAHRRSSYRDVPLRRLTNVVVRHDDDPFDEPAPRIEVFLVGRGHYDAHHDKVELRIGLADLVTKSGRIPLAPFALVERRADIAMRLAGARGEAIEYPGVICSREGQRLAVGSFAPDLLTDAFGS